MSRRVSVACTPVPGAPDPLMQVTLPAPGTRGLRDNPEATPEPDRRARGAARVTMEG
ncbi:hypothetical protein GCM10009613_59840 [Pseudonocardia kongjuensis]|uniref:Uncharacterized protein n=1 Tax=Pseudonocardia kongjuensis TaxID=102227 RepID=A0ABP4IXK9_9PSEU